MTSIYIKDLSLFHNTYLMTYFGLKSYGHMYDDTKITLADSKEYFKSIDTIMFFVQNVEVSPSTSAFRYADCERYFNAAFKAFKVKVVRPLKILCTRMALEGVGINRLFNFFLNVCVYFHL